MSNPQSKIRNHITFHNYCIRHPEDPRCQQGTINLQNLLQGIGGGGAGFSRDRPLQREPPLDEPEEKEDSQAPPIQPPSKSESEKTTYIKETDKPLPPEVPPKTPLSTMERPIAPPQEGRGRLVPRERPPAINFRRVDRPPVEPPIEESGGIRPIVKPPSDPAYTFRTVARPPTAPVIEESGRLPRAYPPSGQFSAKTASRGGTEPSIDESRRLPTRSEGRVRIISRDGTTTTFDTGERAVDAPLRQTGGLPRVEQPSGFTSRTVSRGGTEPAQEEARVLRPSGQPPRSMVVRREIPQEAQEERPALELRAPRGLEPQEERPALELRAPRDAIPQETQPPEGLRVLRPSGQPLRSMAARRAIPQEAQEERPAIEMRQLREPQEEVQAPEVSAPRATIPQEEELQEARPALSTESMRIQGMLAQEGRQPAPYTESAFPSAPREAPDVRAARIRAFRENRLNPRFRPSDVQAGGGRATNVSRVFERPTSGIQRVYSMTEFHARFPNSGFYEPVSEEMATREFGYNPYAGQRFPSSSASPSFEPSAAPSVVEPDLSAPLALEPPPTSYAPLIAQESGRELVNVYAGAGDSAALSSEALAGAGAAAEAGIASEGAELLAFV